MVRKEGCQATGEATVEKEGEEDIVVYCEKGRGILGRTFYLELCSV